MSKHKSTIVEVFEDNFVAEMKRLSSLLEEYNFVSMDTEFPGTVYQPTTYTNDFYYKSIKMNVDNLKLIQVGITLSDERGRFPPGTSTWQFNLKFDLSKDKYSYESIALLSNSGIDFEMLIKRGIAFEDFAEYLVTSGLILNEEVHWVSFHGAYDFAYLLKLIANCILPETETAFLEDLELYFKNFYDIRILLKCTDNLKGSLNKIAQELDVVRIGTTHQAGSDSIVTAEVFFKLFKRSHLSAESLQHSKNVLFGLGDGADENETLSYTFFNNLTNAGNMGSQNPYSNFTVGTGYSPNLGQLNTNFSQKVGYNNYSQYPSTTPTKSQTPLNVLYPLINPNTNMNNLSNIKPTMYPPYGIPQMQMYNMNNSGIKPLNNSSSSNVNVLNSGSFNNNNNNNNNLSGSSLNSLNSNISNHMNIITKEKKKNFGKAVLEAYSN